MGRGNERRRTGSSSERYQRAVADAVCEFGAEMLPLVRSGIGEQEASLTSPIERLLSAAALACGAEIRIHPQASYRELRVRPDMAVMVGGALCGVVELKRPGFHVPGTPGWGRRHDREQFEKLSAFPNVLYTDGQEYALFQFGTRVAAERLVGDLDRAGRKLAPDGPGFARLLRTFLLTPPTRPRDLGQLIRWSAGLCHMLLDEVTDSLLAERRGRVPSLLSAHLADWQEWLFPDLDEAEFADAYAQTVTFGLLLARRAGVVFEGLEIPEIGGRLAKRHLLVGRALSILTTPADRGPSIQDRSIAMQTMVRVIGVADWTDWPVATSHHQLYEDFLEAYDPALRRATGSYYTPRQVTDFMVGFVDRVLTDQLGVETGLSRRDVVVLDPAAGTGTFLRSVVDQVAERARSDGDDVPGAVRSLLPRLIGFERQIGPFSVSELKLDQALQSYGVEVDDREMRLYVADTLGDPGKASLPARAKLYDPLAKSLGDANRVKTDEEVMVVLGNPPYRRHAKPYGRWVLAGRPGAALLDDFRLTGNGRHEYKLHDMAVYFWRWALWKAFESPANKVGVVAFITTKAYLDGPGFAGMREYLRRMADIGWIIDLSAEGHWSSVRTRVFPGVPHPVCIGVFARTGSMTSNSSARIRYLSLSGTIDEKYARLATIDPEHPSFLDCPSDPTSPLRPIQPSYWTRNPRIDHLFPFGSPGIKPNRNWVHHPDPEVLKARWRDLVTADSSERRTLLKETRDRTIDTIVGDDVLGTPKRSLRDEASRRPRLTRIGFRSFDRHHLVADGRVLDYPRPSLWRISAAGQIFLVTQVREPLTAGPAAVFSTGVPDTHFMHGRGGLVLPLYRDGAGRFANAAPGLPGFLSDRLGIHVRPADVMPYVAGVVAHSGYTARFAAELRQPGVRVPLTADAALWRDAVDVGNEVMRLHTYGEWPNGGARVPRHLRPRVVRPISARPADMPERIDYDPDTRELRVGTGALAPVSEAVWRYEVSGMRIVKHWFDYRKADPAGRRGGSPLDSLHTRRWPAEMTEELRDLVAVLEACLALQPRQAALLDRVLAGTLITAADLEDARVLPPPPESRKPVGSSAGLF
ncbi:MAG TPA: type ISP restriction/modification enzyme [Actinocatenispora sp.]